MNTYISPNRLRLRPLLCSERLTELAHKTTRIEALEFLQFNVAPIVARSYVVVTETIIVNVLQSVNKFYSSVINSGVDSLDELPSASLSASSERHFQDEKGTDGGKDARSVAR